MDEVQRPSRSATDAAPPRGSAAPVTLTFMIADVRGYTAFTRERGDAAAALLAKKFADLAREAVEARSGRVLELRGDEALAVFASPAQAVRAAIEFEATCAEESRTEPALQLPVGIGIDAGEAVPVEDGYRGVALNMAARLCSSAGAGQVLVTRTVMDRAGALDDVVFAERGRSTFKGFEESVEVIEALAVARPAPTWSEPGQSSDQASTSAAVLSPSRMPPDVEPNMPLVGREGELRWLRGTWRQVRRGRGRVLFVAGPPQIGKTRLAAEFAGQADGEGADVRSVGAGGTGAALALSVIRDATAATRPALIVVDDADVAGAAVAAALEAAIESVAARPALILALIRQADASPELASAVARADERGDGLRALGALDVDGVRDIVAVYAGPDVLDAPVESMVRSSRGVPGRVHEVASDWARSEASRRLAAAAEWLATGRARRSADLEFANNVIALKLGRLYTVEDATGSDPDHERCPYQGLAPFEAEDAQHFFGRERLVGDLAARTVGSGLLGVVGPSGSGKSSLIAAGLLPSLSAGLLPGSERWRQVSMRPGEHPLEALYQALAAAGISADDAVRPGPQDGRAPAEEQLVICVDQFEETFTTCTDDAEREAFLNLLADVADHPDRAVVVLGIRSDFYGHCAPFPRLAAALASNNVLVGPMTADELRRAIELPARRNGVRIESTLVDALADEVVDEPGGLPLLSTALVELWPARDDGWIRSSAYERTGGVRGAVARLAESAFAHLTDAQKDAARRVLLRLVATGDGDSVTRRRVSMDEFDLDSDPAAAAVIAAFAQDRLLTMSDGTVEVAHEALLREWPRLREWIEEDAQGRQLRMHVTQAARQWHDRDDDSSELYRGARLSAALDWSAGHAADLNELEREFLSASRQASERDADRQRRTNRRLRGLLVGVGVFLIVALVAGSLALVQRSKARASASRAETAATDSLANTLGADGIDQLRLDRGLLLSREAMNLDVSEQTKSNLLATVLRSPQQVGAIYFGDTGLRPQHIVLSANGAMLAASFNNTTAEFYDAHTLRHLATVQDASNVISPMAFSPDGRLFAGISDGNGDLKLVDTTTFKTARLLRVPPEYKNPNYNVHFTNVAFSPDGRSVWYGSEVWPPNVFDPAAKPRSLVEQFDVQTGRMLRRLVIATDWQIGFALSEDGSHLIVTDQRGVVFIDTATGVVSNTVPLHGFEGGDFRLPIALSPDGKTMAIARDDGTITAVSLADGSVTTLTGPDSQPLAGLEFTPDGTKLVTIGEDRLVLVWDTKTGQVQETLTGHAGPVHGLATDGKTIYTSSLDGTIFAWDLSQTRGFGHQFTAGTGDELGDPVNQPAMAFALTPDGRSMAVGQSNGTVVVWDLSSFPYRVARLIKQVAAPGGIPSLAYSPDGGALLVTDLQGHATLVNMSSGASRRLVGFTEPIAAAGFSPNGKDVAATQQHCDSNGCSDTLGLWDVASGRLVHPLAKIPGVGGDVTFSPDGRTLAVPVGGPTALIDVARWKLVRKIQPDADGFAAFSPNGRILATTGGNGLLRLWDTRTWNELGPAVQIASGNGLTLSFDPTGHLLATTGTDGTVRILDVSHSALATQFGPSALPPVTSFWTAAAFTRDGSALVVVNESGQAWVWPMRWQSWAAYACATAGRQLSRAEWSEFVTSRPYGEVCPPSGG
jgi:WD40 repeat protein/class 3 adenylate cyclase